jgi:hypothetical protein
MHAATPKVASMRTLSSIQVSPSIWIGRSLRDG